MQGFNMGRYVPPDAEGTTSGNALHRRRAPGTLRADGTQTVRFEMPYAVWCTTCAPESIIGQGVRFNAVKAKVGSYYSTPIWTFRIRHPACGGTIEIRTDPQNTAYVVTEGGRARDYGDAEGARLREGEGGVPILTAEQREQRREDAFAALEGKAAEKKQAKDNTQRIEELYRARERDWEEPGKANKRLRDTFRQERKARERETAATEALQERIGTHIDILQETEEDRLRARLVAYGGKPDPARSKAVFSPASWTPHASHTPSRSGAKKPGKVSHADALRRQLVSNTRAALNPFGT